MNAISAATPLGSSDFPSAWVERLFSRFAAMYGRHWLDVWADVPMADVKNAWREALQGVEADQIRKALEYCQTHNKFPPTAPEFSILCRDFKISKIHMLALPSPKSEMPPEIKVELDAFIARQRGIYDGVHS